jgi:glycosyltransferase involved in cell wall biosynthesis
MRIEHQGLSAARNAALDVAKGEIVAYIDDDNVMDPGWLRAVVWAFGQHPRVDVIYGAFVIDDVLRTKGVSAGALPRTSLLQWDRETLRTAGLTDIGAIAHRSGLTEARFDETLKKREDRDLLIRLTADRDPLMLPTIACYYLTDAPNRLSADDSPDAGRARVGR